VFGYIEPFYEAAEAAIEPGHIWTDHPVYMPPRHGLKLDRVSPTDDTTLELSVCGRTADIYGHPPVKSMNLASGEAAVVAKTKRNRPVIVLGGTTATEVRPAGTTHAGTVMVVPVYGADQYDTHTRRRMAYYEFTNVFYLPEHDRPKFDEGYARLDHAQPIDQRHLGSHRGLKLAPEAVDVLVEWFVAFTTNRLFDDSQIPDYRRDMLGDGSED
jgi:hypothetical protein